MENEADLRLLLDAQGFVPRIGVEIAPEQLYKKRKKMRLAQIRAQQELERRRRLNEKLGYERQTMLRPRAGGPSVDQIIAAVALAFNLPRELILSKSRKKRIMQARHVVSWELRYRKRFSTIRIGMILKRDHSTVTNSIQFMHANRHRLENELRAIAQLLATERSE